MVEEQNQQVGFQEEELEVIQERYNSKDWNGTSWSTGDALNTSNLMQGSGPKTESIVSGGATSGPRLGNTEVYNGMLGQKLQI